MIRCHFPVILLLSLIFCISGYSQVYHNESFVIELKSGGNGDTYITSSAADKNYGESKYIIAGLRKKNLYWILFFFRIPFYGEKIYVKDARLTLFPVLIEEPEVYNFYLITDRFFPSDSFHGSDIKKIGVTWNTMPPFDSAPVNSVLIEKPDVPVFIDIRRAVQKAMDSKSDFCGILLKNSKDFSVSYDTYAVFYSSNNTHPTYNEMVPRVEISILREIK